MKINGLLENENTIDEFKSKVKFILELLSYIKQSELKLSEVATFESEVVAFNKLFKTLNSKDVVVNKLTTNDHKGVVNEFESKIKFILELLSYIKQSELKLSEVATFESEVVAFNKLFKTLNNK